MGGDEIEERRERDLSSLGLSGRAAAYNLFCFRYHKIVNGMGAFAVKALVKY